MIIYTGWCRREQVIAMLRPVVIRPKGEHRGRVSDLCNVRSYLLRMAAVQRGLASLRGAVNFNSVNTQCTTGRNLAPMSWGTGATLPKFSLKKNLPRRPTLSPRISFYAYKRRANSGIYIRYKRPRNRVQLTYSLGHMLSHTQVRTCPDLRNSTILELWVSVDFDSRKTQSSSRKQAIQVERRRLRLFKIGGNSVKLYPQW